MKDGTVEYILLKDLIENDVLKSKGQINGLNNIKDVVNAEGTTMIDKNGGSGWSDTLIIDNNNHYYAFNEIN